MFARVNTSVHICLRCQRRLLNNIPANPSSQLKPQSPLRRWQSNAVAEQEEEDEEDLDDDPASAQPPRITWGGHPAKDKSRPLKWSRTASLGVDSFGQPAEVLILKAHDRRFPKAVDDTRDEDEPATTLQESLDSEHAPLDHASLHRAIEDVYHKFVGKRDNPKAELTLKEFDSIQKQITESFTPAQMLHYLNAHSSSKNSSQTDSASTTKPVYTRSMLLKNILTDVWKMSPPIEALEERKRAHRKKASYSYVARDEAELDHLLTDRRQPLNEIAKKKAVIIEVYRRERRLKVTGAKNDAQLGVKAIAKYVKKRLESIVVQFSPEHSVYADPSMRDAVKAFLQRTQEKHRLHIALRKTDIKIVHNNMPSIARQAAREIRMAGDSRLEVSEVHVRGPHNADLTALKRFPTPPDFNWKASNRPWHRLLATTTSSLTPYSSTQTSHQKHDVTTILQKLKLFLDSGNNFPSPTKRQDLRSHVTAQFGQALFRSKPVPVPAPPAMRKSPSIIVEDMTSEPFGEIPDIDDSPADPLAANELVVGDFQEPDNDVPSEILNLNPGDLQMLDNYATEKAHVSSSHESQAIDVRKGGQDSEPATIPNMLAEPAFSCDVPYALQQLTNLSPWKTPIRNAQPDIIAVPTQTIYRLEFACPPGPNIQKKLPIFELYVSSTVGANKSQRPLLKVLRLSAIHDQRSFYVLCPNRHVDIKFTQQLKHDLVYPNKNTPNFSKKILTAFEDYLTGAQLAEHNEWSFRSALNVAVDSSLRNVARRSLSAAPAQDNRHERESSVSESKPETTENKRSKTPEYCLRRAEIVEMDSHSMPIPTTNKGLNDAILCLENITFSAVEHTRQELHLSDQSLFSSPNLKEQNLTTLVNGALGLAEYLGSNLTEEHLGTQVGSFVSSQNNWNDKQQADSLRQKFKSIEGNDTEAENVHDDLTKVPASRITAKAKSKKRKPVQDNSKSKTILGPDSPKTPDARVNSEAEPELSSEQPDSTAAVSSGAKPKTKAKPKDPNQRWIGRGSAKAKAKAKATTEAK